MSNQTASASPRRAFLGVDTGSISTKGVIIDENRSIDCADVSLDRRRPLPGRTPRSRRPRTPDRPRTNRNRRRGNHGKRPAPGGGDARRTGGEKRNHRTRGRNDVSAPRRAHHPRDRRPGFENHLRGRRRRRGLCHEYAMRRRNGVVSRARPTGSAWRSRSSAK